MLIDIRLHGTKCEDCISVDTMPISKNPSHPCATCLDRPTRGQDVSHYVKSPADLLMSIQDDANKQSKYNY